jgi:hypothetical protein
VTPYSPVGRNWYFVGTCYYLLLLWRWRHNIPPKRCYPPNIIWCHNPEERDMRLDLWEKHQILETHGASCTSLRCACFDSELGHRLSWLRILFCSSVAPGILPGYYIDCSMTASSQILSSSPFINYYTTPHCTRYWPIDTMNRILPWQTNSFSHGKTGMSAFNGSRRFITMFTRPNESSLWSFTLRLPNLFLNFSTSYM